MKLVIGVDFSDSTDKIVEKTEELARQLSAKVWVIHVTRPLPTDVYVAGHDGSTVDYVADPQELRDSLAKRFHKEHRQVQAIAGRLREAGEQATALLLEGQTADTILREAARLDADMIIVGSHGHGAMYQLLMGSVSEEILRHAECPVLIVPTHKRK
jgi:nucleotide-binding universal stress UspA family protein